MRGKHGRTAEYLEHMIQAIGRINEYTNDMNYQAFICDTRTQDAVIRNLEVLGEAARNVQQRDPAFVAANPDVPWALVYRMRNALSHGYADVDLGTVWNTVRNDLPPRERRSRSLLGGGAPSSDDDS